MGIGNSEQEMVQLNLEGKVRPNKKMSVFRVMGLKILGRVGTHIFLIIIFSGKKNYAFLKGISPFTMHKINFFQKT